MIGNKLDMVLDYCKGKVVLDIGCVEELSDFSPENLSKTQHFALKKVASKLVGIDLEEAAVDTFKKMGFECYSCLAENAHALNIGQFDVVVIGDIIEHIPDPHSFLVGIRPLLRKDGVVFCTTPNALAYSNTLFVLTGKRLTRYQHVCWYCKITLRNLFLYSGYHPVETHFCNFSKTARNPFRKLLDTIFCALREELSPVLFGVFKNNPEYCEDKKIEMQKQRLFAD